MRSIILKRGYSLIEILMVIALISVLATVFIIGLNPAHQFAKARDTQRETHLVAILSSVTEYQAQNSGALPDTDGDPETSNFPTEATCIGSGVGCFDLSSAGEEDDKIVPAYMPSVPVDPSTGTTEDTGYTIYRDENDRLIASATPETKDSIELIQ